MHKERLLQNGEIQGRQLGLKAPMRKKNKCKMDTVQPPVVLYRVNNLV